MHFLCLHGIGTNSQVFETQTATIRYEMDKHHSFDFAEGTEVCPIAPEIERFFPSKDTYFCYCKDTPASLNLALEQLARYIEEEGPFDGVIAFSQGAGLVSTYLLRLSQQQPLDGLPFRCAIFISAARPYDPQLLKQGEMKWFESDGKVPPLKLPTAHIWGFKDVLYGEQSEALWSFCEEAHRGACVHGLGHEIPGPRAKDDLQRCMRTIHRTIDRASNEF